MISPAQTVFNLYLLCKNKNDCVYIFYDLLTRKIKFIKKSENEKCKKNYTINNSPHIRRITLYNLHTSIGQLIFDV